jgi:holo-[acyl-carrier protein] synthase
MQVRGLGMDLVEIERVARAQARNQRFAARICTPAELAYCNEDSSGKRLAGRFAAKEAVGKAIGVPLSWHDVEVLPDEAGKPQVTLTGKAKEIAGGGTVLVTITHTDTSAAATAMWMED